MRRRRSSEEERAKAIMGFFFFFFSLLGLLPFSMAIELFNPSKLQMFVDELPAIPVLQGYGVKDGLLIPGSLTVGMYETTWKFHRDLPATRVFAYGTDKASATVPGPTIEALVGVPTTVTWENHLPSRHILPLDPTIVSAAAGTGVPTVVHLHGGVHSPASDGNPGAWFTANFSSRGPAWSSPTHTYPNVQESGNLWYHDHALGLTRVNILAGLAGAYNLRDPAAESPLGLPSLDRNLVVFDRTFAVDGSIYMNATGVNPTIHPHWQPEYFGDAIIVNGKAWPFLKVPAKKHRFRILNASNARFLHLFFTNGLNFTFIGSDSVYLRRPVTTSNFLLAPSEIADVVVDFAESDTPTVVLANDAPYPYPSGDPADQFSGKVMRFIITGKRGGRSGGALPKKLLTYPSPAVAAARPAETRYITMYEYVSAAGQPTHLFLNGKSFEAAATELPRAGTSEVWHVINLTEDDHPLHVHLGFTAAMRQRELVGAEEFKECMKRINDAVRCHVADHAVGRVEAIPRYERGWKNVVKVPAGFVTTVVVRFALLRSDSVYPFDATAEPGYVYHCHILDHEDNEMMRPLKLKP